VCVADGDYSSFTTRARERLKASACSGANCSRQTSLPVVKRAGVDAFYFCRRSHQYLTGSRFGANIGLRCQWRQSFCQIKSPVEKMLQKDDIWQALRTIESQAFFRRASDGYVASITRGRLSKFQTFASHNLEAVSSGERLFDIWACTLVCRYKATRSHKASCNQSSSSWTCRHSVSYGAALVSSSAREIS